MGEFVFNWANQFAIVKKKVSLLKTRVDVRRIRGILSGREISWLTVTRSFSCVCSSQVTHRNGASSETRLTEDQSTPPLPVPHEGNGVQIAGTTGSLGVIQAFARIKKLPPEMVFHAVEQSGDSGAAWESRLMGH